MVKKKKRKQTEIIKLKPGQELFDSPDPVEEESEILLPLIKFENGPGNKPVYFEITNKGQLLEIGKIINTKNKFCCCKCNYTTKYYRSLERHYWVVHDIKMNDNQQYYKCKCGYTTKLKGNLNKHTYWSCV